MCSWNHDVEYRPLCLRKMISSNSLATVVFMESLLKLMVKVIFKSRCRVQASVAGSVLEEDDLK